MLEAILSWNDSVQSWSRDAIVPVITGARARRLQTIAVLLLALLPCRQITAETNRSGMVQFSNGDIVEGAISMSAGSELKIHTGKELKSLSFEQVQEMVFEPEKETMEQKWRFPEAGQTRKEKWGESCPVREIRAIVTLADGAIVRGHMYTTVLYLEGEDRTTKIVLRAKDRGSEGQTFDDLIYPVRIAFNDNTVSVTGAIEIKDSHATELVALTPGTLLRLPGARSADDGAFRFSGLLVTNAFMAVKTPCHLSVGWPANGDTGLVARVGQSLANDEDFFDSKKLLGVCRIGDDVYSLLMLSRKRRTTLKEDESQPWRLEIWRWKDNGERMMVACRGFFFRGIIAKQEEPPTVVLSPEIWATGFRDGAELP